MRMFFESTLVQLGLKTFSGFPYVKSRINYNITKIHNPLYFNMPLRSRHIGNLRKLSSVISKFICDGSATSVVPIEQVVPIVLLAGEGLR